MFSIRIGLSAAILAAAFPGDARAAAELPFCLINAPLEGTTAAQAQIEARVRSIIFSPKTPHEGRILLMLNPADGGNAEFSQRAVVEISHVNKDPQEASEFYRPKIGWQKIRVTLEKTRGTGDKSNPYRLKLAGGRDSYGDEALSKGSEREAGAVWFKTDNYGGKDIGVPQMDLGQQLERQSKDMTMRLENTGGELLASWTIAAADIKAGYELMQTAYGQLADAADKKTCRPAAAIGPY